MRFFYTLSLLLLCFGYAQAEIGSSYRPVSATKPESEDPKSSFSKEARVAQMKKFLSLSRANYQKQKGRKLNILEKASFKISEKRISKMLARYEYGEITTLQKISWFLRGILLGPIAVLLAYLFLADEERALIKWAWFGFAGWSIILAIIFLL